MSNTGTSTGHRGTGRRRAGPSGSCGSHMEGCPSSCPGAAPGGSTPCWSGSPKDGRAAGSPTAAQGGRAGCCSGAASASPCCPGETPGGRSACCPRPAPRGPAACGPDAAPRAAGPGAISPAAPAAALAAAFGWPAATAASRARQLARDCHCPGCCLSGTWRRTRARRLHACRATGFQSPTHVPRRGALAATALCRQMRARGKTRDLCTVPGLPGGGTVPRPAGRKTGAAAAAGGAAATGAASAAAGPPSSSAARAASRRFRRRTSATQAPRREASSGTSPCAHVEVLRASGRECGWACGRSCRAGGRAGWQGDRCDEPIPE